MLHTLIGTAEEGDPEPSTDELLKLIAPFAHPIKLASPDPAEPSLVYHYVADEFGSRITMVKIGDESQEPPNIKMAAFYDGRSHQTYCVLWPCAAFVTMAHVCVFNGMSDMSTSSAPSHLARICFHAGHLQ